VRPLLRPFSATGRSSRAGTHRAYSKRVDETYIADKHDPAPAMSVVADLARALVETRNDLAQILRVLESTQLPVELGEYVDRFDVRARLITHLTTTQVAIDEQASTKSCAELASIAAVSALKLISERATVALDRERITRFQDELIRIVGHDLRAPLGAIEVGIEMLANASDSTVAIARISSFTKRLSRIVDHVVDLTRARLGGGIPLARTHTRLAPLVTYVVREVAAAHPQHHIELVDVEDVRGIWDEDRIAQVLRALLTNAAQYGRERGTVEISVKSHPDAAATITVRNELQGAPLPAAALATMFDAYRRGSDDAHIGTGIGLSLFLAQQIVRAHRGSISVESSPLGTTFHVVLPDAMVTP